MSRRPIGRMLPPAIFLVAAAGLTVIAVNLVAGARSVALRTARDRLSSRAHAAAGSLTAAAANLSRRAALGDPDAVAGPNGAFLRPVPPRPFPELRLVPGRDPEASFYLAAAGRAESADGSVDRAVGLYRAAAAKGRDRTARLVALFRLAALHRRYGDVSAAQADEKEFLSLLEPGERSTLQAVIVRARAREPDPDLERDLLEAVGSRDESVALGLLRSAGIDDPSAVARRRQQITELSRLAPILAGPARTGDGCVVSAHGLVAFVRRPGRSVRFAEGPLPPLPDGVRLGEGGKSDPSQLVERMAIGAPFSDLTIRAWMPRSVVRAAADRGAVELGGALVALLLAGAAALTLIVKAARREAAAAREKTAFATRVGHDLRTPLALIRMYAETLESGKVADPAQAREFAGIAAREAERLTALVGRVLDLSRVAGSDGASVRRTVDLSELVAEVARAHEPLLGRAGMRLNLAVEEHVFVTGDPAALRGATANLVENALRHAAEGGAVDVACTKERGDAVVTVADRGPGIPPDIAGSVFERFVRGPEVRAPGAGLGLALVREVARAHGGEAETAARDGGGVEIRIRLPLRSSGRTDS